MTRFVLRLSRIWEVVENGSEVFANPESWHDSLVSWHDTSTPWHNLTVLARFSSPLARYVNAVAQLNRAGTSRLSRGTSALARGTIHHRLSKFTPPSKNLRKTHKPHVQSTETPLQKSGISRSHYKMPQVARHLHENLQSQAPHRIADHRLSCQLHQ